MLAQNVTVRSFSPYSVNAVHEVCIDACATPYKGSILVANHVKTVCIDHKNCREPLPCSPSPYFLHICCQQSSLSFSVAQSACVPHSAHHTSIITSRLSMATVPSSNTLLLILLALDNVTDLQWTELIEATQAISPPHNALHSSRRIEALVL